MTDDINRRPVSVGISMADLRSCENARLNCRSFNASVPRPVRRSLSAATDHNWQYSIRNRPRKMEPQVRCFMRLAWLIARTCRNFQWLCFHVCPPVLNQSLKQRHSPSDCQLSFCRQFSKTFQRLQFLNADRRQTDRLFRRTMSRLQILRSPAHRFAARQS